MLQICDIRKQYKTGDLVQTALDGVSLTLRSNEFVAILGPSGSGKTTLLNVIGGLDRYDSGDLIINGISTKKYSDRDWDSYRNHTIGFVFQSYNLIPHQTVLSNVELALTISGISRSERRKLAKKALEDVGLGNQLHKKPNQMSGGQMQRVAIARALVNDPSILLADEPTGALDSDTSVQVMELLKEVSKDRLVVMVTHNPELAEAYANRIVRVRDGKIIDDSNPYEVDTSDMEPPKHKNMGKASMSFLTALALSFNNLRTKMGRTLLTAFAGSIGIIGIALIMSLSNGFQKYIDKIQEDTLSNYPLMIQAETADMTTALAAFGSVMSGGKDAEPETVVEQQMIAQMFAQVGTNDLGAFKTHLEENYDQVADDINDLQYGYGIKPLIYAADTSDGILQVNPGSVFMDLTGSSAMSAYMDSDIFKEMIGNVELLDAQYDVLRGRWPESKDEMIIVLSDPNQISDYMAYTLGLKDPEELQDMIKLVMEGKEIHELDEPMRWTYDDLMALEFRLVPASGKYRYNSQYNVWEDMSDNEAHMRKRISEGHALKIVGIVCPKEGTDSMVLSTGVAYTSELTQWVIQEAAQAQIVQKQLDEPEIDVFTGKSFSEKIDSDSGLNFEDMITVDEEMLSSAFGMNISQGAIVSMFENYMEKALGSMDVDTSAAQADFNSMFSALATEMLSNYISANADPQTGKAVLKISDAEAIADSYLASESARTKMKAMEESYRQAEGTVSQVCDPLLTALITNAVATTIAPDVPDLPDLPELPDVTAPTEPQIPEETTPETEPTEQTPPADPTEQTQAPPATDGSAASSSQSETPEQPSIPTAEGETQPPEDDTVQTPDTPDIGVDINALQAKLSQEDVPGVVSSFMQQPLYTGASGAMSTKLMDNEIRNILSAELAKFGSALMRYMGNAFYVNEDAFASAFQFNMNEEDLRRLMETMSGAQKERSLGANLRSLGYADTAEPTSIAVYFVDFESKENFLSFLDEYNDAMEAAGLEDLVISYTDITGIMMSSVRTIIDSVSYVLIAFVAVSLIVSSIMIGIITYISVMERTKEIGVLRAIGASKRNISQVFNAETFIIGLCSGLLGVGVTLILIFPINHIIGSLTNNPDIRAQLPFNAAVILVVLSMILTIIGGWIPSKQAAKKDPVIALRSE